MMAAYTGARTTGFASPATGAVEGPIDLAAVLSLTAPGRYPVRVAGASFVSRGVLDGDILIADTAALPRSGRLVIASAGGQILLAELRRQDTGWVLVSGDATRQALRVDPSQDVDIWGHVVGLVRTEV